MRKSTLLKKCVFTRIVLGAWLLYGGGALLAASVESSVVAEALRAPVLEKGAETADSSKNGVTALLSIADDAANEAFLKIKTEGDLQEYQRKLRRKWIDAIGGFPERTPLNARTINVTEQEGYRIEKVLFESQPGLFVTGHLFLPNGDNASKVPYPGIMIVCGHTKFGKGAVYVQRGAVQGVQNGFAVFVFDPIDQGERQQLEGPNAPISTRGHNHIGVSAILLGWNTARFRIWDAIRALDYMQSREEIDPQRLGVMGCSGGGTLSSYTMAMDERIKAAAPSCYITTFKALCEKASGPQDAEQNIFGQIKFGMNHAGYLLARAPSCATCLHFAHDDFFPLEGSLHSYGVARSVLGRLGWSERLTMMDMPGQHGWPDGACLGSIQWMRRWLMDDDSALPLDFGHLIALNDMTPKKQKEERLGLIEEAAWVTENGQVRDLPGARTAYDLMRDELLRLEKNRKPRDPSALAQVVREITAIRPLPKIPFTRQVVEVKQHPGFTETRQWFEIIEGIKIPAVTFMPERAADAPQLLCDLDGKDLIAEEAGALLAKGHPVMAVDITEVGEISSFRGEVLPGNLRRTETVCQRLYLLGDSLVAVRAEDLLVCADTLSQMCGGKPVVLRVRGNAAVAASHAYAMEPRLFSKLEITGDMPLSWSEVVRNADRSTFNDCVHGALRYYDWTELLSER